VLLLCASAALLAGCGGGDECTFTSQCVNNVLQTCHKFTRNTPKQISTEDCGAENASCVTQGNSASCVGNCGSCFVTHCAGTTLVTCQCGLISGVDCYDNYATAYAPGTCLDQGNGNAECVSCP
jgi:hypothetical protein